MDSREFTATEFSGASGKEKCTSDVTPLGRLVEVRAEEDTESLRTSVACVLAHRLPMAVGIDLRIQVGERPSSYGVLAETCRSSKVLGLNVFYFGNLSRKYF